MLDSAPNYVGGIAKSHLSIYVRVGSSTFTFSRKASKSFLRLDLTMSTHLKWHGIYGFKAPHDVVPEFLSAMSYLIVLK